VELTKGIELVLESVEGGLRVRSGLRAKLGLNRDGGVELLVFTQVQHVSS